MTLGECLLTFPAVQASENEFEWEQKPGAPF